MIRCHVKPCSCTMPIACPTTSLVKSVCSLPASGFSRSHVSLETRGRSVISLVSLLDARTDLSLFLLRYFSSRRQHAVMARLYLPPLVDIFNKITRRKAICTYKNIILSRSIGPIYNMYRSCTFIICIDKILRVTSASFVCFWIFFFFFFFFFFLIRFSHITFFAGDRQITAHLGHVPLTLVMLVLCLECEEKHGQQSHDNCIVNYTLIEKRLVYEFSSSIAERS